jgi:hypothetical protein
MRLNDYLILEDEDIMFFRNVGKNFDNPEDPHFNYTAVKTSDLPKENKKGEKLP